MRAGSREETAKAAFWRKLGAGVPRLGRFDPPRGQPAGQERGGHPRGQQGFAGAGCRFAPRPDSPPGIGSSSGARGSGSSEAPRAAWGSESPQLVHGAWSAGGRIQPSRPARCNPAAASAIPQTTNPALAPGIRGDSPPRLIGVPRPPQRPGRRHGPQTNPARPGWPPPSRPDPRSAPAATTPSNGKKPHWAARARRGLTSQRRANSSRHKYETVASPQRAPRNSGESPVLETSISSQA